MAVFPDTDLLYACVRTTFDRIQIETPTALKGLLNSRLTLRFRCSDPTAEIVLNGRDKVFQATYGASTIRPDLDIELAGDTLHDVLLERLTITKAVGSGLIKVKGPIWKVNVLSDLIHAGRKFYPDILREFNLPQPPQAPEAPGT